MTVKTCEGCGEQFVRPYGYSGSQWEGRRFCSRDCSGKSQIGNSNRARHGHAHNGLRTSTYDSWGAMLQRCDNPNNESYDRYGGRGIAVCDRWRDFVCFLKDMGERPPGLTIERIDNDGNYEPGNCRWASKIEQAQNTSLTVLVEHSEKIQSVSAWARELGVDSSYLSRRIRQLGRVEALDRAQAIWRPGQAHPNAKLSEADVLDVKRRLLAGERVCDIATMLGVDNSTISAIAKGKNWAWLKVPA